MKIITRLVIALATAAASLMAVSCARFEYKDDVSDEEKVFRASFESVGALDTKTYLDSEHKLLWTADDRLSIFEGNTYNQQYRYTGQTGKTSADFEKVQTSGFHSGNDINSNYAVYPYLQDNQIGNDGTITVTLPAVQLYAANSFGLGANTMVAVTNGTSDTFLAFKNLCGYLVIKLYGEGTVKSIAFKGNNGEKIAGSATVIASYGSEPKIAMASSAAEEITLDCGSGVALGLTSQTATEFWFCIPPVTFSEGFSIRITNTAGGVMEKSISSSRTISRNTINSMSALEVEFSGASVPVPEMVDLSLPSGLKWASFNLGASKPEEYGGYYQWAGLEDVTDTGIYLYWSNCPYHTGSDLYSGWTKYIPSSYSSYWSGSGSPDNKTVLDPEDDVAHVMLGGKWRMPTKAEFEELYNNCTSEWTTLNGVTGSKFTSKTNDKSIFLPAAGCRFDGYLYYVGSYGYYWSSSLYTDGPVFAYGLYFGSGSVYTGSYGRCRGLSVRPVYGDKVSVTGVSLSKTSLNLVVGAVNTLSATVTPSSAAEQSVSWSSNNPSVATVDAIGKVTALKTGSATITVKTTDGGYTATCQVTVVSAGPVAVDLGLPSGLKWASFNLGASAPEEYGGYYQWAGLEDVTDTSIYLDYSNCPYHTGSSDSSGWTKYNTKSFYGTVDNKTVLDPEDDVAHVKLGGKWRMPTEAEFTELINNCTSVWTTLNGVNGRKFTSKKNGNSIFLPAAGYRINDTLSGVGSYGLYWSSSLRTDYPCGAYDLYFYSVSVSAGSYDYRYNGRSVRPVSE